MVVSSDGSEAAGVGGWGYVAVTTTGQLRTACGVVKSGPGTVSSYRAESYGLLAGMRDYVDHKHEKSVPLF